MNSKSHIGVVGAGLVGSMISIYLARRGYKVSVFERRPDMRKTEQDAGRSINLALSSRGLAALEELGLSDDVKRIAIPMHGRMMHDKQGKLTFQPYGKQGQYINSVSRSDLNKMLMAAAESLGVEFFFEHRCVNIDLERSAIKFSFDVPTQNAIDDKNTPGESIFDRIIGADGAFSATRLAFQFSDRFNLSQDYIEHGYKELHIPAGPDGAYALDKNTLHIWPRESFMMIALPNPDGSFTCTLFFPFDGPLSFNSLNTDENIVDFFSTNFPDALVLMPTLLQDFKTNPTSSLITIKCFPWVRNNTLLIGDAAHAVVPFYGQGMNAGFEDCRILNQLLNECNDDWAAALSAFQRNRKPDADAIATLALDNFVEMRDLVADREFLLRKKIEARLHELFPEKWVPLYTMVTFSPSTTYSHAYATGRKQKEIMDKVMSMPGIDMNWEKLNFAEIADQLK
jgi:kynurenine 3-monooxygenase